MTTIVLFVASAYVAAWCIARLTLVILEALHLVYHAPPSETPEAIRYIAPWRRP